MYRKYSNNFWKEVKDFNGEFVDIIPKDEAPFSISETEFRHMTTLEKTLYTLYHNKLVERNKIVQSICGKDPNEVVIKEERSLIKKIVEDKATVNQKFRLGILLAEASEFLKALHDFPQREIDRKFPDEYFVVSFKSNFRVMFRINLRIIQKEGDYISPSNILELPFCSQ